MCWTNHIYTVAMICLYTGKIALSIVGKHDDASLLLTTTIEYLSSELLMLKCVNSCICASNLFV